MPDSFEFFWLFIHPCLLRQHISSLSSQITGGGNGTLLLFKWLSRSLGQWWSRCAQWSGHNLLIIFSTLENGPLLCLLLILCRFVCPFPYDVINRCSGEWLKYSHSIEQRFVLAELMQFFCLLTFNVSGDSTEARSQFVEAGTATGLQLTVIHLIFSGNLRLSCRSSLGRPLHKGFVNKNFLGGASASWAGKQCWGGSCSGGDKWGREHK